jgi:hypothetical protein
VTSIAKLTEAPPTADATEKPISPVMNVSLRPNRSPSRPPNSSRLQVVGEEQEDAEDRDPGQPDRDVGAAPGPVQDHPQRQQRLLDPALSERERGQQDHPADQRADSQGGGPAGQFGMREPKTMRNSPAQASTVPAQSIPGRLSGRLVRM